MCVDSPSLSVRARVRACVCVVLLIKCEKCPCESFLSCSGGGGGVQTPTCSFSVMRERRLESCERLGILCDLSRSRNESKSRGEKWRQQDVEGQREGGGVVIIAGLTNAVFRFLTCAEHDGRV